MIPSVFDMKMEILGEKNKKFLKNKDANESLPQENPHKKLLDDPKKNRVMLDVNVSGSAFFEMFPLQSGKCEKVESSEISKRENLLQKLWLP